MHNCINSSKRALKFRSCLPPPPYSATVMFARSSPHSQPPLNETLACKVAMHSVVWNEGLSDSYSDKACC